jgi:hypothetical protein
MKNYIITVMLLLINSAIAQSSSDVGKISISVVMPENVEGLDISQLSKMETKITQIVNSVGLAGNGNNNNFVIYPKFAIYESDMVEGGMQNINVVKCEWSLFIKQVDNNIIYASISIPLKGYGKEKGNAITDAISKINTNTKEFSSFIQTGKKKILDYYNLKCQDIITKSESLVKMQDYEQAIGLLMSVPEEVSCYNKIQEKTIDAYKSYQNQKCITQLQEAKTTLAKNQYQEALDILSLIDPSTKCFTETQLLIKKAEVKVDAQAKTQFALRMKIYNDTIALEKQRIQAAKEMAIEYYRNQPKPADNYLLIVR